MIYRVIPGHKYPGEQACMKYVNRGWGQLDARADVTTMVFALICISPRIYISFTISVQVFYVCLYSDEAERS